MAEVRVECVAGHRGEETPRRVHLDGRRLRVVEVRERRLEAGPERTDRPLRVFRVLLEDERGRMEAVLVHDTAGGAWRLRTVDPRGG